jgi:hypothetical protein
VSLAIRTALIGVLATLLMDLWGVLREPLFGFPRANYRLIGRWFAHMPHGRFHHASIAASPSRPGEHAIGWLAHYSIGILFAALLVWCGGADWLRRPTPGLAMSIGLATLAAPLLLMQPAMGAGIAASRTAKPWAARTQSAITHAIYGLGLYLAAWTLSRLAPLAG